MNIGKKIFLSNFIFCSILTAAQPIAVQQEGNGSYNIYLNKNPFKGLGIGTAINPIESNSFFSMSSVLSKNLPVTITVNKNGQFLYNGTAINKTGPTPNGLLYIWTTAQQPTSAILPTAQAVLTKNGSITYTIYPGVIPPSPNTPATPPATVPATVPNKKTQQCKILQQHTTAIKKHIEEIQTVLKAMNC